MKSLFARLGITDVKSFWKVAIEFVKFGLVGVSNAVINLVIYYVLVHLGFHYILANTIGFVVSVLNSFLLNSKFVFTDTKRKDKRKIVAQTFIAYGFTFLLSTIFLFLMVDKLNISDKIAPLINIVITTPINFSLNKFWVHRKEEK